MNLTFRYNMTMNHIKCIFNRNQFAIFNGTNIGLQFTYTKKKKYYSKNNCY